MGFRSLLCPDSFIFVAEVLVQWVCALIKFCRERRGQKSCFTKQSTKVIKAFYGMLLSHYTVLRVDNNSSVLFLRVAGLVRPWHLQLHRREWCHPASSLWHLLTELLWHSSSPSSKPTAVLPVTHNTRPCEFIRVTASLLPDVRKRTAHSPGLKEGQTAKDGVLQRPRPQCFLHRAQSPRDRSGAEENHEKVTAKLQVFVKKSSWLKLL